MLLPRRARAAFSNLGEFTVLANSCRWPQAALVPAAGPFVVSCGAQHAQFVVEASWLRRSVSSPARSRRKSGALVLAAHTTSSAGTRSPLASITPSGVTAVTRAPVRTRTRRPPSNSAAEAAMRSGSEGRMRGPASISWRRMSRSGLMRSRLYETSVRVALCSSADNSTPVWPAPMMATCNWCGASGASCVCARRHALTSRRWKRLGLRWRLERDRVFCNARRAEVVGVASHGDHQRVVGSRVGSYEA